MPAAAATASVATRVACPRGRGAVRCGSFGSVCMVVQALLLLLRRPRLRRLRCVGRSHGTPTRWSSREGTGSIFGTSVQRLESEALHAFHATVASRHFG